MSETWVESPCIGVCELDLDRDWCKGCFRTRDEVARWGMVGAAERRDIVENANRRRADAPPN
ncbi:MAG: DUF1289 domain-containing protein [Magnetovibrio sp.]|nr:DUF1289 domain-containing protein [Magnetovibrio sp.]